MVTQTEFKLSQYFTKYLYNRFLKQDDRHYIDIVSGNSNLTYGTLFAVVAKSDLPIDIVKNIMSYSYYRLRPWCGVYLFEPNKKVIIEKDGLYYLNRWRPSKTKPYYQDKGIEVFYRFLHQCLGSSEKVDFMMNFLAHRYQNPLEKVGHALYIYGSQGQGKTTFANIIEKVFGESSIKKVGKTDDLYSKGSIQNWSRIFVIGEEIKVKKGSSFYSELKSFTGTDKVEADEKHKAFATYKIPAQLIMLSNEAPTFLEEDDRRFFVTKWETNLPVDKKGIFFSQLQSSLDRGGYEAIAWELKTHNLSSYKLYDPPPLTREKTQMLLTASNPATQTVIDKIRDNVEKKVWADNDFSYAWDTFRVQPNQKKYILQEAGLEKIARVKVHGKHRSDIWVRKGFSFIPGKGGQEPIITDHKNFSTPLKNLMQDDLI